jgi:predicted HNH restriction endonuclease
MEEVDITGFARELRFVGSPDRLPRMFSGRNFQSMRELTRRSASLLTRVYGRERRQTPEEVDPGELSPEGRRRIVAHYAVERSSRNRRDVLAAHSVPYVCTVCDMDFATVYGLDAALYMQVHHRVPIASRPRTPRLNDFATVCANCHAMLHWKRGTKPLTVEKLRSVVQRLATVRFSRRRAAGG